MEQHVWTSRIRWWQSVKSLMRRSEAHGERQPGAEVHELPDGSWLAPEEAQALAFSLRRAGVCPDDCWERCRAPGVRVPRVHEHHTLGLIIAGRMELRDALDNELIYPDLQLD